MKVAFEYFLLNIRITMVFDEFSWLTQVLYHYRVFLEWY